MAGSLKITVTGLPGVHRLLGAITPSKNPQIFRGALTDMGESVQRAARANIRDGSGRPSRRHLTNRTHTTRRSIFLGKQNLPRSIAVDSTSVAYYVHELGSSKYPKRAFLLPALQSESRFFEGILLRHIDRAALRAR